MADVFDGQTIAFRVDGNSTIGFGHAVRCISLAQAVSLLGGNPVFFVRSFDEQLARMARSSGIRMVQVDGGARTTQLMSTATCSVFDGYQLGAELESALNSGQVCVAIDDQNELPTSRCDLIVNQNFFAQHEMYPARLADSQLLGPRFAMLRRQVRALRPQSRTRCEHALVTFGGADPMRMTLPVTKSILKLTDWTLSVAVPTAHPDRSELLVIAEGTARLSIDRGDLVTALARADVAAIGAGTTVFEVAYMQLPTVGVATVDNQRKGIAAAQRAGVLEQSSADSDEIVERLMALAISRFPRELDPAPLVDGYGAHRVARWIARSAREPNRSD